MALNGMLDKRLDLRESQGILVNISFNTTVLSDGSGGEERNIDWQSPLLSYSLQKSLLRPPKLKEVIDLFQVARGAKEPFRYRDWSDYRATAKRRSTRYGSSTQGFLYPQPDGSVDEFSPLKSYSIDGCTHYREIIAPDVATLKIYDGDEYAIASSEYSFQENKIKFNVPPAAGEYLLADFEFDVPVTFSDRLNYKYITSKDGNGFRIEGLELEEVRLASSSFQDEGNLNSSVFELCGHFNSSVGIEEKTEVVELTSGFDKRTSRYESARFSVNLGKIPLKDEELDYLIAFWRCAKGQGQKWGFYEGNDRNRENKLPVRFAEDSLAIRLKRKGRYEIDGISLIEVLEPFAIYQTPPYQFSLSQIFISPVDPKTDLVAQSNPGLKSYASESQLSELNKAQGREIESEDYNIKSFTSEVGFKDFILELPADRVRFVPAQMFWAAETLWLLASSQGNIAGNNWLNRCALFKLNGEGNFQYVDSPLKNYYSVSFANANIARIFQTPTGVALFCPADDSVVFGDGIGGNRSGILRFEIEDDGSQFIDFIHEDTAGYNLLNVVAVFGNRVYVDSTNTTAVVSLGFVNGLEYVVGQFLNGKLGYPVSSSNPNDPANITTKESEPDNWYFTKDGIKKDIYHDSKIIETYYTAKFRTTAYYDPDLQYIEQSSDGSILARIYERDACPDNTCAIGDSRLQTHVSLWIQPSIDEDAVPLPKIPLFNGDAINFLAKAQNSNNSRITHDRFGNALYVSGNRSWFYRSKAAHAIETSAITGSNLKTNEAITKYGFAVFANEKNLFEADSNPKIIFVQP